MASERIENFYRDYTGRRKSKRRSSILKSAKPFDEIQNTSHNVDRSSRDRRVSFANNVQIKEFSTESLTTVGTSKNRRKVIQVSTPTSGNQQRRLSSSQMNVERLSIIPKCSLDKSFADDSDDFVPYVDEVLTPETEAPNKPSGVTLDIGQQKHNTRLGEVPDSPLSGSRIETHPISSGPITCSTDPPASPTSIFQKQQQQQQQQQEAPPPALSLLVSAPDTSTIHQSPLNTITFTTADIVPPISQPTLNIAPTSSLYNESDMDLTLTESYQHESDLCSPRKFLVFPEITSMSGKSVESENVKTEHNMTRSPDAEKDATVRGSFPMSFTMVEQGTEFILGKPQSEDMDIDVESFCIEEKEGEESIAVNGTDLIAKNMNIEGEEIDMGANVEKVDAIRPASGPSANAESVGANDEKVDAVQPETNNNEVKAEMVVLASNHLGEHSRNETTIGKRTTLAVDISDAASSVMTNKPPINHTSATRSKQAMEKPRAVSCMTRSKNKNISQSEKFSLTAMIQTSSKKQKRVAKKVHVPTRIGARGTPMSSDAVSTPLDKRVVTPLSQRIGTPKNRQSNLLSRHTPSYAAKSSTNSLVPAPDPAKQQRDMEQSSKESEVVPLSASSCLNLNSTGSKNVVSTHEPANPRDGSIHEECDMELAHSCLESDVVPLSTSGCLNLNSTSSKVSTSVVSGPADRISIHGKDSAVQVENVKTLTEKDGSRKSDELETVSSLSSNSRTTPLLEDSVTHNPFAINANGPENWLQAEDSTFSLLETSNEFRASPRLGEETFVKQKASLVQPEPPTKKRKSNSKVKKRLSLRRSLIQNLRTQNEATGEMVDIESPEAIAVDYRDVKSVDNSIFDTPDITMVDEATLNRQSLMMSPSGFTKFLKKANCDKTLADETFSKELVSCPVACIEVSTEEEVVEIAVTEEEVATLIEDDPSEMVLQSGAASAENEHQIEPTNHQGVTDSQPFASNTESYSSCTPNRNPLSHTRTDDDSCDSSYSPAPPAALGEVVSSSLPSDSPPSNPLPSDLAPSPPPSSDTRPDLSSSDTPSLSPVPVPSPLPSHTAPRTLPSDAAPSPLPSDTAPSILPSDTAPSPLSSDRFSSPLLSPTRHEMPSLVNRTFDITSSLKDISLSSAQDEDKTTNIRKSDGTPLHDIGSSAFIAHVHSLRTRFLSIIHNCQIRLANSEYVKSHKSFKIFLESIITRASIGLSVLTTFIDYGNISGLAKARGPIPFIPEASISESKVGERFEWMKGMHTEIEQKWSDVEAAMVSAAEIYHWQVDCWNRSMVSITIHNSAKISLTLEEGSVCTFPQKIAKTNVRYGRGSLLYSKPQTRACTTTADIVPLLWTIIRHKGNP